MSVTILKCFRKKYIEETILLFIMFTSEEEYNEMVSNIRKSKWRAHRNSSYHSAIFL